jgi:pantoate--beta-alanine ligase
VNPLIVIETIDELRQTLGNRKRPVGFVPTMGYLHEGHASLIRRARLENATVVLSIFVNPLQFGPNEDFDRYPRDKERDLALAEASGVDIVFMPNVREMYPRQILTNVSVDRITDRLCGASRPGHFDGVATVVSKLFHIAEPDNAYFGMKDAQQVAVIRRMADDLNMKVNVVPCPILRDEDGLALSSRNVYLSEEERNQALSLSAALAEAGGWLAERPEDWGALETRIRDFIGRQPLAVIDYVQALTYPSLSDREEWLADDRADKELLVAVAVKFGNTRLIDNRLLPLN